MASFRFYKRVNVFPGVAVNVSKSGPSLTMGVRGAHVTVGPRGVRRTIGIPGTGLFYTETSGHHTGVHTGHVEGAVSEFTRGAAQVAGDVWALVVLALVVGA